MPTKVKVILNAHGGLLKRQAKIDLMEQALRTVGLDYQLAITEHPEHGLALARQAASEGWPVVVAAGGDGTINEVVNGLMQADPAEPRSLLGIIPLGTGNDLSDALAIPRDVTAACQRLAAGNTRLIDLGLVNDRYFANNSAVGLEPVVTVAQNEMRYAGSSRYMLAAIKTILTAKPWSMRVKWDHGIYEGPVTLVSIGNNTRTGGSFYMTPKACLDDGLLDVVYAVGMSRWQLLRLLPKTLSGQHINHPLVTYQQTKTLSITATPPTPIHADGEVFDRQAIEINYQIFPKKLRVIV
ncbi:MAG: diacylglycerol kinase family lipid kinase [Anaerolineaceae bacterium]|nr:diacylglycerol kinase family lipid kinase [Anaerolineaceae bacterium]MCB9100002.1 diacylglycerol kinase family lipid kinase [Anaerolineales bacterium]